MLLENRDGRKARLCITTTRKQKQLSEYLVPGRSLTTKGHRFSINFFLLDVDIMDIKQMMELGAICDDERWWSSTYSGKASQRNC